MHIKEPEQQHNYTLFQVHKFEARQLIIVELEVKEKKLLIKLDIEAALPLIFTSTKPELFQNVPLRNTSTMLTTYMRQQITMGGRLEIWVRYGEKAKSLQLNAVEGNRPNLLERDWLIVMQLDWGNLMVTTVASVSQTKLKILLMNYQEIFQDGFGKMNFQGNLTSQVSL